MDSTEKQLKRLFVSGKVTLENPLCDSIIKAQANEIDLSYRYSDSLEIKMQALNRTAIDYQIEAASQEIVSRIALLKMIDSNTSSHHLYLFSLIQ